MQNNKKLSFITGAALAVFSAGVVHAADLAQTDDVTGGALIAEGDKGCHKDGEKGCGKEMKGKKKGKKHAEKKEEHKEEQKDEPKAQ